MPESDVLHKTIEFDDPKTGQRRSFPADIPKGKEKDGQFLDKLIDDYLAKKPTGTEYSSKRGSLKVGPAPSPGMKFLEKIAPYLPFGGAIERAAGAGEETNYPTLRGLEDTAASAFDLMSLPGVIKMGVKPSLKAVAGYTAGSVPVEKGLEATGVDPTIARGAGMLAGMGAGSVAAGASPKVSAKIKAGKAAAQSVPVTRATMPGLIGWGVGTQVGAHFNVPYPWATLGPLGAAIANRTGPFIEGFRGYSPAPLIRPELVPAGEGEGWALGMGATTSPRPPVPSPALLPAAPRVFNMPEAMPDFGQSLPALPAPGGRFMSEGKVVEMTGRKSPKSIEVPAKSVQAPTETPESLGKKQVPVVNREAMESQAKGIEQPQPKPTVLEDIEPKPAQVIEMPSRPVKTTQQIIEETNAKLKEKTQGTQTESKGAETEKTSSEAPKDVKQDVETKTINPQFDELLGKLRPDWEPSKQITFDHLYKAADALGVQATPLARSLIQAGYDVQSSKFGQGRWGLERVGKKDLNDVIDAIGPEKLAKILSDLNK